MQDPWSHSDSAENKFGCSFSPNRRNQASRRGLFSLWSPQRLIVSSVHSLEATRGAGCGLSSRLPAHQPLVPLVWSIGDYIIPSFGKPFRIARGSIPHSV